jgi:hypothetical protein
MKRRLLTVATLTPVGVLGVSGLALALWTVASTGAAGSAAVDSLGAAATVSTSNVTATSVSINVDAKPATGPTPTSYRVDRTAPSAAPSVCTITGGTGSCVDSNPVPGVTNTYAVYSRLGTSWVSASSATASANVPAVDTTPPSLVSITRGASTTNPTNAGPLSFTVTFSEPVTGVTAARFALASSGTGGTSPSIGTPSPVGGTSPATAWTVAVSTTGTTGTNSGSIGLSMSSTTGVTDAATNAMAGTGIPFTGQSFSYDTTAPTAPTASYVDNKNSTADAVSGSAEANATITIVESSPTAHTYTGTAAANGTYSVNVDALAGSNGKPLSYSYTVTVTDAAGNVSSVTTVSGSDSQ